MNDPYAPYAPPQPSNQAHAAPWGGGYGPGYFQHLYKPLGWRTTACIVGIIATVALGFAQTGATLAFGDVLRNPAPENLGMLAMLGLVGLLVSAVSIFTWVMFLVWTHLAAKNVRAFGQEGLEYTPGWAVGWWFIPVASMWKPFDAMREIWRASDPETVGRGASKSWRESVVPGVLTAWWIVYVANGVISLVIAVSHMDFSGERTIVAAGPSTFITHALLGVAGLLLILLMKRLAANQTESWRRLQSAPADLAGPGPYGNGPAAGAYGAPAASTNPYV